VFKSKTHLSVRATHPRFKGADKLGIEIRRERSSFSGSHALI